MIDLTPMPRICRSARALSRFAAALCLAVSGTPSQAEIYKWKDDKGVLHFSDQPPENPGLASTVVSPAPSPIVKPVASPATQEVAPGSIEKEQKALEANLHKSLKAGDPAKTEIFLLTFAGDSKQSVFMKESLYVQKLFARKYGTAGHSLALINHKSTTRDYLIASPQNLSMALKTYAKLMNEDDILYLYLSSHGSRDHQLVIDFRPYTEQWLDAQTLRQILDESGIKWRVVVVSACYSGGFVEPLKSPTSLIATASDAASTSFGCSDDREFTYFGEVIFKNLMTSGVDFVEALRKSPAEVTKLESRMNTDHHSKPQFWMGEEMRRKLADPAVTAAWVKQGTASQARK